MQPATVTSVDRELLATLRSDAMQIRVCVLSALAKYAFSQVNESIPRECVPRGVDVYRDGMHGPRNCCR